LWATLIEGNFPEWRNFAMRDDSKTWTANASELASALAGASIMTSGESVAVRCEAADGELVIAGTTPELGAARTRCAVEPLDSAGKWAMNPAFWRSGLRSLGRAVLQAAGPAGQVRIGLAGAEEPIVLRQDDWRLVVAPMDLT
jgi:DNA polymerase III sliding clamp (beta) subunit (PCNA family)